MLNLGSHLSSLGRGGAKAVACSFMFLVTAGCDVQVSGDAKCEGGVLYGGCTLTNGSYGDFSIGMSKEAAYQRACNWMARGGLEQHPVLYTQGRRNGYYKYSICNLRGEALVAERWDFVRPGFRRRSLTLQFEGDSLARISWGSLGMDP